MKEWVRLPSPDEESCVSYLLEARTFVSAVVRTRGPLAAAARAAETDLLGHRIVERQAKDYTSLRGPRGNRTRNPRIKRSLRGLL